MFHTSELDSILCKSGLQKYLFQTVHIFCEHCTIRTSTSSHNTGCGRNNSHILKGNKNQTKQGTQKILLFIKSTYDAIFFSNTFKDNITQVAAVIDDTLLKPFTEVVHDFAGHRGRKGGDFLSYCLL